MMKIKLRGILFGVIILLLLASSAALAQIETQEESKLTGDVTTLAAPPMSEFINIRVDGRENQNSAVAYNSKHNEYLVVWDEEIHGGENAIYGRRVGPDGSLLGPAFPIQHYTNTELTLPDVVYNSKHDEYLVVYTWKQSATDYDIRARQVKWNGALGYDF